MKETTPLSRLVGNAALFAAAILPSFIILGVWFSKNKDYPSWDASDYFITAVKIYNLFAENGWAAGFQGLFFERSWRPTLGGLLQFPAIALAGGHVLIAMRVFSFSFMFGLFAYTYSVLRRHLTTLNCILVFWSISLMPWVLELGTGLLAELPYLMFLTAALDHFERSEGFKTRKHALLCGVFMGLAICTRPAEAALIFTIAGVAYLCVLGRKHCLDVFSASLLILTAALPAITIGLYWNTPPDSLPITSTLLLVFAIMVLMIISWRKTPVQPRAQEMLFSLGVACVISVLWLLPFWGELKHWILESAIGGIANNGPWAKHESPLFQEFRVVYSTIELPCILIVVSELIRRIITGSSTASGKSEGIWNGAGWIVTILVFCIPIITKSFSPNEFIRLYYGEIYLALLVGLRWYMCRISDRRFLAVLSTLLLICTCVEVIWDKSMLSHFPEVSSPVRKLPFSVEASFHTPRDEKSVANFSVDLLQLLPKEQFPPIWTCLCGDKNESYTINLPGIRLFFLENFHREIMKNFIKIHAPLYENNASPMLKDIRDESIHYAIIGPHMPISVTQNKAFRKIGKINFIIYNTDIPQYLFYIY